MGLIARLVPAVMAAAALLGPGSGSVGASMAQAQVAAADWQPTSDDQWLFELRTDRFRIGEGIRGYADGSRVCITLTDVILALDLPIRVDPELRRATGWAFDERRALVIDRDARRVDIASRSRTLPHGAIIDTAEGWCVDPQTLGDWLGVTLSADTANSVLRLDSDVDLPFELAAQRRARAESIRPTVNFNLANLPQARRPYALLQLPSVDVVASATYVRDAVTRRSDTQIRYELFASGEALGASIDARLSSDASGVPQSVRVRAFRSDPAGNLLGPLRATHVGIGDVTSLSSPIAAQPVVGRGAIATNRPLDLPDSFDRTTFRGDLPAGWDAELYRNGQLLGFATPGGDGRYEFVDVRLMYGMNRFEIVLYGPQGQVRREVRTIPVGIDAIPPQKTYYWAGILQEGKDLLSLGQDDRPFRRGWRGTIGVERGLNRRTSVGAWATTLVIEDMRYDIVEASLRRAIGPTLAEFTGSWQNGGGHAARLYWVGELGQGFFQLESLLARNGYRSDRIALGVSGLHTASVDLSPRFAGTVLPVHVEARYRQRVDGQNRVEAAARASANWRNLSLTGQLDWAQSSGRAQQTSEIVASLLANARFGRVRVRGEAQIGLSGASSNDRVAIVGEWTQSDKAEWRGELGYESAASRVRAGIGYTRRFDRFALAGFGEVASDGSVAAGLSLSFGFGPDPRNGGIRFSRERLATQGQALATVFYDDNGDGHRQQGEAFADNVVLTAGNAVSEQPTDSGGQAIVDALAPFRPVLIGIDESSLPNPLIRPAVPGVVVTPRPGVITNVLIPLVSAGEVEGVLVRAGGTGIEGIDIELVDARGNVRAVTRTDFDGFFLFESIVYGQYTVRISALSAQAANLSSDLGAIVLDRERPRVRMGVIAAAARPDMAEQDRAPPARSTQVAAR
jgi:hypothetical protein